MQYIKKILILLLITALFVPTQDVQAKRKCGKRCRAKQGIAQVVSVQAFLPSAIVEPTILSSDPSDRPTCLGSGCFNQPDFYLVPVVPAEPEDIYVNPDPEPTRPHIQ